MIQRIQSVYLLLAGIIPAFTFCTPIITFSNGSSLMSYAITGTEEHFISCPWGVLAFTVLSILTALFTIFNYKNRPRQIRLCNLFLFLSFCFTSAFWPIATHLKIATTYPCPTPSACFSL